MTGWKSIRNVVLILALSASASAQMDGRWAGIWAFIPAKSTYTGDAPFRKGTLTIVPAGEGLTIVYDMFRDRGGVTHLEWTGRLDGKDYPLRGVDGYAVTNAYRAIDAQTYEVVQKVDGVVSTRAVLRFSPDGKTLTTETPGRNALGEAVTATSVYEKQ